MNQIPLPGGAACPTRSIADPWIEEGRLHEVRDAPCFPTPAFVVYPAEPVNSETQSIALEGLSHIVSQRR